MYNTVYKSAQQPRFCTQCGSDLIKTTEDAGYNAYTGEKAFRELLICRNKDDKTIYFLDHDVWEVVENVEIPGFGLQTYEGIL